VIITLSTAEQIEYAKNADDAK